MKTRVMRSSVPELGWCAELSPDDVVYHRSWHYFETRQGARDFARKSKANYERNIAMLNKALDAAFPDGIK